MEAEPAANFEFIRYLVEPRKAEGKNLSFTIAVGNDGRLTQIRLRNSVMIVSSSNSKGGTHVDISRRELAEFVLGLHSIAAGNNVLADFESTLDRSHLIPKPRTALTDDPKYIAVGEH